jgi:hypothetical protein
MSSLPILDDAEERGTRLTNNIRVVAGPILRKNDGLALNFCKYQVRGSGDRLTELER